MEDPAQATVTGVASGSDHYIKQTVYYMPGYVTYTVKRMKEMTTGNYVEASSEENYGVPDSIVTASDVTYPGFVRTTTDLSLKVTADGKAVKYIYYDRNPRSAIYFSTSGSELSPVIGNPGDAVPAVPNPTRTGYTFAGWDLNDDGIADSLPRMWSAYLGRVRGRVAPVHSAHEAIRSRNRHQSGIERDADSWRQGIYQR